MAHPYGGHGNRFETVHTFAQAYAAIGDGLQFPSTSVEYITATRGVAGDGVAETIVFVGECGRHGNVCEHC